MPRVLDRYPENIKADFRNCSAKALRSYISRYNLHSRDEASVPEMASVVARHFDKDMEAREEDIIPNFVNFILNYNGGNIESKSKSRSERYRRGTRASSQNNDSEAEPEESVESKKTEEKQEEPKTKLYCFCQRKSFGDMIACDGENCKIEWFHVGCVGLDIKKVKAGEWWYCSTCDKSRKDAGSK